MRRLAKVELYSEFYRGNIEVFVAPSLHVIPKGARYVYFDDAVDAAIYEHNDSLYAVRGY